jgi:hypothetical protein
MASGLMWVTKGQKNYPETDESGQFWRSTMIDMDSRLRVARGIAKTETDASIQVFKTLKARGHPDQPPPTVSDGWGGIREAMVEVYGTVPPYSGRGRPPTHKRPGSDWQYLQIVKIRNEQGRLLDIEERVIYGDDETVTNLLGKSTAYIERTHLTMRHFNARLTRKTLAFSKKLSLHQAAAALEDAVYNFVRPLKTLRLECLDNPGRRWQPRTPAMVAGLTNSIWTVKELLSVIPLPALVNS